MERSATVTRLEILTNAVVIVTCIAVVAALIMRWRVDNASARAIVSPFQNGETLEPPNGVHFSQSDKTVLVFISSRCQFCTSSMPYYARLSQAMNSSNYQVAFLGIESEAVLRNYVESFGLENIPVFTIANENYVVRSTPTIVVVDRTGVVLGSWIGLLKERERDVDALLTKESGRS